MNKYDFKRLHMCEYRPDPILEECIAFMRYATPKEIYECKHNGLFESRHIREAKRIINQERNITTALISCEFTNNLN